MSRPSSVYRSSLATSLNSAARRTQGKSISIPMLELGELAECLLECNFAASEELLSRPTPQYVQTLFSGIAEYCLGISPDTMRSALAACASDTDYDENQNAARHILGLQRSLYRFFLTLGIEDFSITDIVRPESLKIRKLLCAFVNYARYREQHFHECEELLDKCEQQQESLNAVRDRNEELRKAIAELEAKRVSDEQRLQRVLQFNSESENKLRQMKKIQEQSSLQHSEVKALKQKLLVRLEENNYNMVELRKEVEILKKYISENPQHLAKRNADAEQEISCRKNEILEMEHKMRLLLVTLESVQTLTSDVQLLLKTLEDTENELKHESDSKWKLNKLQELHESQQRELDQLERSMQQLERQVSAAKDRVERTKQQAEEKRARAQQKMRELRDTYGNLAAEQTLKDQELAQKLESIKTVEKQMADMKAEFDKEFRETTFESQRLYSHITTYLNEMDRKLTVMGSA